jgi:Glycosyl hydrolase family 12
MAKQPDAPVSMPSARQTAQPRYTVGAAPRSYPQSCQTNWCTLPLNDQIYLLNNQWGVGAGVEGSQSITTKSATAWATTWNWQRDDDWCVTSYPAAILGWHWGVKIPGTGLPLPIRGTGRVVGDVVAAMDPANSPSCRFDIAYDCWAHASPNPPDDGSGSRFELMIWTSYSQDYLGYGQPYIDAHPTIGGVKWKVLPSNIGHCYDHPPGTIDTVSFLVDGPNVVATKLDILEFLRWIVDNRRELPPSPLLDELGNWYLTGVEFGTEAYKGSGVLDVSKFVVTVEAGGDPAPEPEPPSDLDLDHRAALAVSALSEDMKAGRETNVDQGIRRAYDLVDAVWAARRE